ncbi:hypothetical protein [Pseudoxanthomonas sp. CF125]|uniref:hypothetical protein n=1 Tax=Pseudoxanthomonas sp. CF125 TaxID=1855303 RepID=UPI0008908393|nr:hypothetical protein [Pseudoxanthomonas sp. CF125]SDQ43447.1 hypothetical protein SAMN05216569_1110 [Pseudoxanthomonas sp. CF125]
MTTQLMSLTVQTKDGPYGFRVMADPKHLDHWRAVGVDIEPINNLISDRLPARILGVRTTKPYQFLQDVFGFKNPWSKT